MSIALPAPFTDKLKGILPWGLSIVAAILFLFGTFFHDALFHRGAAELSAKAESTSPGLEGSSKASTLTAVTLPEEKLNAADIRCRAVLSESIPSEVTVSGRIEANGDRSLSVHPRAPGVIREVNVVLGQIVKKGEVLARVDSAEVATARLNLRAKQRALETVRIESSWKKLVAENVKTLIPELRKHTESIDIEKAYADRPLGAFRASLLQAYADFDIASHEESKTKGLYESKIVGEHPRFLTLHNRESSQAKFESVIEQVRFDAGQQSLLADQSVKYAEGEVVDAAQRLKILGVHEDVDHLLNPNPPLGSPTSHEAEDELTVFDVVAPFDGTILRRAAVAGEKVEVTDNLFSLADLSHVWVCADIPEAEFGLIPQFQTSNIHFTSDAAYQGRRFDAKLLSISSEVDPTTRTVAVRAETPNPEGLLKVGLFVRIALDGQNVENALTVPANSVIELEGKPAVFVPDPENPSTFRFRDVVLGRLSGSRQVILSGVKAGELVVCQGAFLLKSELILQNETDED